MPLVTAQEHEQRNQEIERLHERLKDFGKVEVKNKELADKLAATRQLLDSSNYRHGQAQDNLAKSERSHVALREERNRFESSLAKMTMQRDIASLVLKDLAKRVQDGCRVALEVNNHQLAAAYEELLGVLGKHDASLVPCMECGQLPSKTVNKFADDVLECRCGQQLANQWAPEKWLKRRRNTVLERPAAPSPLLNSARHLANVRKARSNAAGTYNAATDASLLLQADQTELLGRIVDLLERQQCSGS